MNSITQAVKSLIPNFDININGISIDSRNIKKGYLFVPLSGTNFNGHDYIESALKNGADGFVYSQGNYNSPVGFKVNDTLKFFQELSAKYIKSIRAKRIAISGSTGKTTLKEILKDIFINAGYKTHYTHNNENNLIGVPKTLLSCPEDSDIIIVELGTNKFGEVEKEAQMVSPHIASIINIGPAHLEYFKDLNGVFKEKKSLIDITLTHNGAAILPKWEKFFKIYEHRNNIHFTDLHINENINIILDNIQILSIGKNDLNIYYMENIALAVGIAHVFHIEKNIIINTINHMKFPRLKEYHLFNKVIIDDAYNANPISFKRSIDYVSNKNGKKGIVLGRIFELGESEEHYEQELVSYIENKNFSLVIVKQPFNAEFPDNWYSADTNEDISNILKDHENDYDVLLIKGSHGTELYKLVEFLKEL